MTIFYVDREGSGRTPKHRPANLPRGRGRLWHLTAHALLFGLVVAGGPAVAAAPASAGIAVSGAPKKATQGGTVSLVVTSGRPVTCRLSGARKGARSRPVRVDVSPQRPVVSWVVGRSASRGSWSMRLRCGSLEQTWKLTVAGHRGGGPIIAARSVRTSAVPPDHEIHAEAPTGQDPASWSEMPVGDFGGGGPDFALPFRCGERWSAATYRNHSYNGNDFPLDFNHADTGFERNAPAVASAAGTVKVATFDARGYGHYVVIDHGGGWTTLYAHLSVRRVAAGQSVAQGTTVGIVGGTPHWAVHLHYEQRLGGRHQPITFHNATHPYAYKYNGPVFTSRNCPPATPPTPPTTPKPPTPPDTPPPPKPSNPSNPSPPANRGGVQSFSFIGQGNFWAYSWWGWDEFVAQSNTLTYAGVVIGNPNLGSGVAVPYNVRLRICTAQPDSSGNCPAIADRNPQVVNYGESGADLGDVAAEKGRKYWILFNSPPRVNNRDWDSFWASTRSGKTAGQRDEIGQTYNLNAVVRGYDR